MTIIPPALLPASAQPLLAIDPQGGLGDGPGAESPFSALLETEIGAALLGIASGDQTAPASGAASSEARAPQSGKLSGKPSGKMLPDLPQVAAPSELTKREDLVEPGVMAVAADADSVLDNSGTGLAPGTGLDNVAPLAMPAPFAAPLIAVTVAGGSSPAAQVQAKAPLSVAQTPPTPGLPAPTAPQGKIAPGAAPTAQTPPAPAQLAPPTLQTGTAPVAVRTLGQKMLARITQVPSPVPPADPALANSPEIQITLPAVSAASPQALQPAPIARSILATLGLVRSAKPVPVATDEPEPASPLPQALAAQPAPGVVVAAAPRLAAMPTDSAILAAPLAAAKPATILSDTSDRPSPAPHAAPAPIEPAQLLLPAQSAAPVAVPAFTVPTAGPAPQDFAALIDRLAEARQTAQATLAPQTVTAAVSHAEFGQVSLHFRQNADGLSVVMASADPDLARAVQIAAPAAQTGTSNEGNPAPRQDANAQQSANTSPSQSQSQAQSQAQAQAQSQQQRGHLPQQRADDPRGNAQPAPRQRGQDEASTRGGIFA